MSKIEKMMHEAIIRHYPILTEVTINLNDVFSYSTSDAESIAVEDFLDLAPLLDTWGDDAAYALCALKRGYDPDIVERITPRYYQAKKAILDKMEQDQDFLYSIQCEIREREEEVIKYKGSLTWKTKVVYDQTFLKTLWLLIKGKRLIDRYDFEVTASRLGLTGQGKNMKEAKADLNNKLAQRDKERAL